jgi:hypothetical protein
MKIKIRIVCALTSSMFAVALALASGCGSDDSGLGRRYSVSGKVTYKGEPVPKGSLTFEPLSPGGRHATGTIENGSYKLTTTGEGGDGALPGEYKVIIISTTVDMTELAKKSGGMVHQGDKDFQKIVKEGKDLIPKKYSRSETSDLKVKVEEKSQTIDLDLKD